MQTTSRATFALATTALVTAALAPDARADNTLTIQATVADACTVDAGGTLNFGDYEPGQPSDLIASTTFNVDCVTPTDVSIGIDAGGNYDSGTRRMADGPGNYLSYQLLNAARTAEWGDSITHPQPPQLFTGLSTGSNTITVEGTVPGGQNPVGSTYSDIVTISLLFE